MVNSVYIHIPFCDSICSYCAFTKYLYNDNMINNYILSLEKEIKNKYQGEKIKTLYIGGGTPSCLTIYQLKKLFSILKIFNLSLNCEFTIEINPESIDEEKLILFKKNKVNRLSVGIESTLTKHLKYLNRKYDFKLIKDKIKLIKKIGFRNINVDLIYGLKNQTLMNLKQDLKNIVSLDITHISTYSLMIEPNTLLYIKKEKSIDEDLDYKMYKTIIKYLTKKGFHHYEISNFSKNGYESKHNLVYWDNQNYYGFGVGASGYLNNVRHQNTTNLMKYIKGNYISNEEILTKKDILTYALILGFRQINGINKKKFKKIYQVEITDLYNIKDLINEGVLIDDGCNLKISYDKIYVENSILINFVGE